MKMAIKDRKHLVIGVLIFGFSLITLVVFLPGSVKAGGQADEAAAVNPPAPAPAPQQPAQQQNHVQANAKAAPAPVVTQPQADETPREEPTGSESAAEPPAPAC